MALSEEERRRIEEEERFRAEVRVRAEIEARRKIEEEQRRLEDERRREEPGPVEVEPLKAQSAIQPMNETRNGDKGLSCPNCDQVDRVQKVSAVVDAGTSKSSLAGPTVGASYTFGRAGGLTVGGTQTTLSGGQQSVLSQRLAPPGNPTFKGRWGSAGILLAFLGLMALMTLGTAPPAAVLFLIVAAMVFAAKVGRIKTARTTFQKQEVPRWEKAMTKWQQLYYCHRCDGVFLPGEASIVPSNKMVDFLYGVHGERALPKPESLPEAPVEITTCAKCGQKQLSSPTCKACGAPLTRQMETRNIGSKDNPAA